MESIDELARDIEGAPTFNDFDEKDRKAIVCIHKIKRGQGELSASDDAKSLEECAIMYRAQKCAFQDVITEKGFEVASEVPRDYNGRIAFLTHHGTFAILGKYRNSGRYVAMTRIHSPSCNIDGSRVNVTVDMELGQQPELSNYKGSELRALAVNPKGADGDELEDCTHIATSMGLKTAIFYINETDHPIKTRIVPAREIEKVK